MQKYRYCFFMTVGLMGMDGHDFIEYDRQPSDVELDNTAWLLAKQHAESYGYYPEEERVEEELEDEDEDDDQYVSGIEGWWEVYDPEKHDGYAIGGVPFP